MTMKKYYMPTPLKWRKLGDALLGVSTMLSTYSVADDWSKTTTILIIVVGALGKFLSNFFADEPTQAS